MRITQPNSSFLPRALSTPPPANPGPLAPEPGTPGDGLDSSPTRTGRFLHGAAGAAAGLGAGAVAAGATLGLSAVFSDNLLTMLPTLHGLGAEQALVWTALGTTGVVLGSALAATAGAAVGARIAAGANHKGAAPDITAASAPAGYAQESADLHQHLSSVSGATSLKGASAAGFRAGVSLGGPAGARVGQISGLLSGAALGGLASFPLLNLVSHPAVLIPGAVAGAFLGARVGEPVGYTAGAVALGTLGAGGAAAYHALAGRS